MRFRRAAIALALLSAACGKEDGETFTVRTRLLSPSDVPDPLSGLDRVRIRVLQDGSVVGERELAPDESWRIPSDGADADDPLVVRVDGLDAGGAVIRTGATRPIVPEDAKGRTYGLFFSTPGEFALPPTSAVSPRSAADVLSLPDGRAIAVGGEDETGTAVDTVTLYDPDAGTWRALAPLAEPRESPGVAVLPDGLTLLVAGGHDALGGYLDSTELYRIPPPDAGDADLGETTPGPTLQVPWGGMLTATLASGKIVLAGGYSDGAPLPALYEPETGVLVGITGGTFAPAGAVSATGDGRVVVVGGGTSETASRVDVIAEDSNGDVTLATGVGALRVPRAGASALPVGPGRVLVTGGETPAGERTAAVEVVDLAGAPVSAIVDRERVKRTLRAAELLGDGRALVAGGYDGSGPNQRAFVFDPATNRMEEVGSLPEAMGGRRYTAPLPDGTVLFFGADASGDVRIFQPPVDPLVGEDRVDLSITLVEGQRAAGAVLDGATSFRVRVFDAASEVFDVTLPAVAPAVVPAFVPDDVEVHVLLEALDGSGNAVAWGATAAPLEEAAQGAGTLTLFAGRVGEFVLAPAALPNPHRDGAAVQLDDGRVAVLAGAGGSAATDVFDPGDGSTAALNTALPTARIDVRFAILPTSLFLVGGQTSGGGVSREASRLDLGTGNWTAEPDLPAPARSKHVVIALANGEVLAHGNDVTLSPGTPAADVWNGTTWTTIGDGEKRSHHRATLLEDGTVLLTGGITSAGTLALAASARLYDPSDDSFTPTAGAMATARRDHAIFAIPGNDAVVCGGLAPTANFGQAGPPVASCERYDGATRTFSPAGSLLVARDDSAVVQDTAGTWWILGGGRGTAGPSTGAVDVWTTAIAPGPPLRTPRSTPAAIALRDGRIVVAGGRDDTPADLATVEIHTPASWTNPFGY